MEIHGFTPGITRAPEQPTVAAAAEPTTSALKRGRSRKRSIAIFIVVSLLNVGLLALLWTQLLTPSKQAQTRGSVLNIGDVNFPLLGKPMPDFTLSQLNAPSHTIHLADFKGKPIILNFWASWCDTCNQEAPFVVQQLPQLRAKGVVFIGIDGQDSTSAALQFVQKYAINYLNVVDTANGATAISYGVTGFPETVFINSKGIVVGKWAGVLDASGLNQEMAKMNV
jgi:cytochrome c biogenesis protein CcmG/thiol:disulfide interchange protein DsbE